MEMIGDFLIQSDIASIIFGLVCGILLSLGFYLANYRRIQSRAIADFLQWCSGGELRQLQRQIQEMLDNEL